MKIGVLFDLDGTLLDTLGDLTDATNYALSRFGCPSRSMAQIRSFVGNGALRQVTLALPGGENDPDPQQVLAVYKPYYEAHCQIKTAPYPGIGQMLTAVMAKYPVAVVSNKPDGAVKALCSRFFPGVYALGEVAGRPRKPAPDMLHKAMADMGVEACIYVGDSEVDVKTAQNAGVPCVCVLWGFRDREQLENAGAERFCERVEDLAALLEKTMGEINGK